MELEKFTRHISLSPITDHKIPRFSASSVCPTYLPVCSPLPPAYFPLATTQPSPSDAPCFTPLLTPGVQGHPPSHQFWHFRSPAEVSPIPSPRTLQSQGLPLPILPPLHAPFPKEHNFFPQEDKGNLGKFPPRPLESDSGEAFVTHATFQFLYTCPRPISSVYHILSLYNDSGEALVAHTSYNP